MKGLSPDLDLWRAAKKSFCLLPRIASGAIHISPLQGLEYKNFLRVELLLKKKLNAFALELNWFFFQEFTHFR
jgi:hypothetical protein